MFHNRYKSMPSNLNGQKGFLIPLAIFILLLLSLLAVTVTRTTTQVSVAAIQEAITTQAFYSAESGAQAGMSQLFSTNANKAAVDALCVTLSSPPVFSAQGLSACSAVVTCSCVNEAGGACSAAATYSYYTVTSVGNCGSADIASTRTVQVSAFMQ